MTFGKIEATVLFVHNLDACTTFYRDTLGFKTTFSDDVSIGFKLGEQDFLLLNEALWAPDASFVVANLASFPEEYQGGRAEIVFLDGRPNVVLAPAARQMKWGP